MNDRKAYMRSTYAKYWKNARDNVYGFMDYDKALIDLIKHNVGEGSSILEVAVGTGEPIAKSIVESGYEVSGIDISDLLIEQCKKNNPEIKCKVDDAEKLSFSDAEFDFTYCVHSAWLIPDFDKAILEMVRVTSCDNDRGHHIARVWLLS